MRLRDRLICPLEISRDHGAGDWERSHFVTVAARESSDGSRVAAMMTTAVAMDRRWYGTIDTIGPHSMMMVYCNCGKIISLDAAQMSLKLRLRKELECSCCRNHRISRDIDELDAIFEGTQEDDV